MKHRFPILPLALGALLLGSSAAAGAQSKTKAADMTPAQVTAKLQAAGYTEVHGIEREGTHFDADATKDGRPVHLHIDVATGTIRQVAHESEEEEEEEEHGRDRHH